MRSKWRFMLWGGIGAGKTSLLRALQGGPPAKKTQMIEFDGQAIDTPGEYSERGSYTRHLLATAADVQLLVVVHDATRDRSNFPPNYFCMFRQPVIGVVTKMDLPNADAQRSAQILREIGVSDEVYFVSTITGLGIQHLKQDLEERSRQWHTVVEKRSV